MWVSGLNPVFSYAFKAWDFALETLIFVRRGVDYCNAVARAIVALLGRFLPRLGPLANASGLFFWGDGFGRLFGRRPIGVQLFQRDLAQALRQRVQVASQPPEAAGALVAALIHIKRAVDLELDGMQAGGRIAVMLGDKAPGIGLIPAYGVAQGPQGPLHRLGHHGHATGAIAVAEHEFGTRTFVLVAGRRRHGMAIDQHGGAEIVVQPGEQPAQRAVIGLVQALNPPQRVVDRNALIIDFLGVANHPRHGSQAPRHPHRAGIGERGQPAVEHARIEFVGLAVHVHEAAREMRAHQRIALANHAGDQGVDEAVLRPAQDGDIELRTDQERARIGRTAVRRIEQHRPPARRRLNNLERRVELVAAVIHGWRQSYEAWDTVTIGRVLNRPIPSIVHASEDNAKSCFWFTRYLPGISLMVWLGPVLRRPG